MPALSIIVPVYKVEQYLRRCVDSILSQTFTDFELILVDDGSPDTCPAICDEYAEKDERIVVIHKENGGQASARNMGLDIAKGDYIGFVDSDDWIHPQMYEILIKALLETGSDVSQCKYIAVFDGDSTGFEEISIKSLSSCYKVLHRRQYIDNFYPEYSWQISNSPWNKVYSRKIFDNIRMPEGQRYEDAYIRLSVLDASENLVCVDKTLYFYYQSDNSTMRTGYAFWMINDMSLLRLHYIDFFRQKGYKEQSNYALMEYLNWHCKDKCYTWINSPGLKKEFKSIQKKFNKEAKNIFFNPLMCNMKRLMMICLYVSPKIAYKIAKKYFPECLYESMI